MEKGGELNTTVVDKSKSTQTTKRGLIPILIISVILSISLIFILACQNYQLKKDNNSLKQALITTTQPLKAESASAISVNLGNNLESVHLLKIDNGTAVFYTLTTNPQINDSNQFIHKMYVADVNLSQKSVKEVFSLNSDVYEPDHIERLGGKYYDYFIVQTVGEDVDFAIFTKDGNLVTKSVRESNEILKNWHVAFDKYDLDKNLIVASLFTIDSHTGTVNINPETAKVVPNSLQQTR